MAIQYANLALRFLLELCALAAVGYWGYKLGSGQFTKTILCISLPLAVAAIWGLLGSPAAPYQLPGLWHLLLELSVFGFAAAALYLAGLPNLSWIFALLTVVNRVLMFVWKQ